MTEIFYPLYTDGKLDAQSIKILKQIAESNSAPLSSLTPEQARESFFVKSWLGIPLKDINVKSCVIENSEIKIPLRIYTPAGKPPFPVLIFFHGGGFVAGSLDEFEPFCTFLSSGASCMVISVDYRLAPEHKHPSAIEDAQTAIEWVKKNVDKIGGDGTRIALAGDSAGANLALVSSLLASERSFPSFVCQVLICPWIDLFSMNTDSYKYFGEGLWLSLANIKWYRNHYLKNEEQGKTYFASPILAEKLEGLPPTFIITAEFDVLRDEGKIFADCLKIEGVPVQYSCYKGMLHDFVTLPGLFDKASDAIKEICSVLKKHFTIE
jgi:acetyl esterase